LQSSELSLLFSLLNSLVPEAVRTRAVGRLILQEQRIEMPRIIGKREIDIYPNGLMFERDHVVGIKPH
jgi:hypothetical protein